MPLTPLTSRSSKIRVCSAAVPSAGILNSSLIFGTSFWALWQPARAIVQKSDALFVKNATSSDFDCAKAVAERAIAAVIEQTTDFRMWSIFIMGGLDLIGTMTAPRR